MRVTNRMMTENAIAHMNENLERLQQLTERSSSGKAFQTMSDDPGQAAMALSLRSTLITNQGYVDTGQSTNDWLSAVESAFKQMVEIGTKATNLARSGQPDTISGAERYAFGVEMDALLRQAVEVGNSSHLGKYIFSGFQVKTPPFELDAAATTVTYNGDNGIIQQDVSPGQKMATNIPGTMFEDFFATLIATRDALLNNQPDVLEDRLGELNTYMEVIKNGRTTNGARQRQVRMVLDTMEKTRIELKSLLSQKEDVNMTEAISLLRQQETVYQTVLEVSSRAISALNLFDVLG